MNPASPPHSLRHIEFVSAYLIRLCETLLRGGKFYTAHIKILDQNLGIL